MLYSSGPGFRVEERIVGGGASSALPAVGSERSGQGWGVSVRGRRRTSGSGLARASEAVGRLSLRATSTPDSLIPSLARRAVTGGGSARCARASAHGSGAGRSVTGNRRTGFMKARVLRTVLQALLTLAGCALPSANPL